jgi:hypothetical protein
MYAPRNIADAVQCHIKALRLLAREDTSFAAIAESLGLTDDEVATAFKDFKIVGTTLDPKRTVSRVKARMVFSPVVQLIPRKAA